MWKKIEFAIVLLLLAVLIMMSNHMEEMVSSGRVTGRNPCIVLDSGHGGEDPGKIGVNQAKEKDVNLKIAKKTKERLEKKGWKVVMTREKDVMLGDPAAGNKKIHDMKARVERINKTMYPPEQLSGCADPRGAGLLLFTFGRGKANGRSDAESTAEGR